MLTPYIALLRGINVGKAKRLAMADLRALVADLGYSAVRTLLNSGNVVFAAPAGTVPAAAAARIQAGIADQLGVSSRVTVLAAAELRAIAAENPLRAIATDPARLLVAVMADPADLARLAPLTALDWGADRLALGTHAAYLWCGSGILESKLAAAATKALGETTTTRNWATITKLLAMVETE